VLALDSLEFYFPVWVVHEELVATQVLFVVLVWLFFSFWKDKPTLQGLNWHLYTLSCKFNFQFFNLIDLLNLIVVTWIGQNRVEAGLHVSQIFSSLFDFLLVIEYNWYDVGV